MTNTNPSPDLEWALAFATDLSLWITERWPASTEVPKSGQLALACVSIAKAHHEGMQTLLTKNAKTPASALVRPILEATLRGFWFRYCATAAKLRDADLRQALPKFDSMIRELSQIPNGAVLWELKRVPWKALSDLTHGGLAQIANWLRGNCVEEVHSDSRAIDLLGIANTIVLIATMGASELAGGKPDLFASKMREVVNDADISAFLANNEVDDLRRELDALVAELGQVANGSHAQPPG